MIVEYPSDAPFGSLLFKINMECANGWSNVFCIARRIVGVSFFCAHPDPLKGRNTGRKKRYNRIAGPARRAIIKVKSKKLKVKKNTN